MEIHFWHYNASIHLNKRGFEVLKRAIINWNGKKYGHIKNLAFKLRKSFDSINSIFYNKCIDSKLLLNICKIVGLEPSSLEKFVVALGRKASMKIVDLPLKLDENLLSRVFAYLMGDGSVYANSFTYYNSDCGAINDFHYCVISLIKETPRSIAIDKKSKIKRRIYIDSLKDLENYDHEGYVKELTYSWFAMQTIKALDFSKNTVPLWILNGSESVKKNFVAALFGDEGSFGGNYVYIYNDNQKLLQAIKKMLMDLNFVTRLNSYRDVKERFCLVVEDAQRFVSEFPILHSKKTSYKKLPVVIRYQTKRRILSILKKHGALNTNELYNLLKKENIKINRRSLLKHLKDLRNLKLIARKDFKNTNTGRLPSVWFIKSNLNFIQIQNLTFFKGRFK